MQHVRFFHARHMVFMKYCIIIKLRTALTISKSGDGIHIVN